MRCLPAAISAAAVAALLAGCGDDEQEAPTAAPPSETTTEAEGTEAHADGDSSGRDEQDQGGRSQAAEVVRVVRDYVRALDDRDGERVCRLLAPGAIDEVELPRDRGGCAASLSASIGYRDPRGLPVWEAARVGEVVSAEVNGDAAKVVATTITLFADRREPSIEDDVVYLARRGGRWLLAKPSSTLYRAVGIADIPPSVLSPP
jgi:hypothetical protein